MSQVIRQHRGLINSLGGYAQTDKERIELLKSALSLIADECQMASVERATLERIRAMAVAAWHGATHTSDRFAAKSVAPGQVQR